MKYLTLYRQWRPQTFKEVVGQKNTVTGLQNAVRENRLAHAYLFLVRGEVEKPVWPR